MVNLLIKIFVFSFLLLPTQSIMQNDKSYCGLYYQDGDKSNDVIRLDSDYNFYFKDKGKDFKLFGTWKIDGDNIVLKCNPENERGIVFYTPASNKSCLVWQLTNNVNYYCKICDK